MICDIAWCDRKATRSRHDNGPETSRRFIAQYCDLHFANKQLDLQRILFKVGTLRIV